MKKWLLVTAAVIIAALAGVYMFIPAQLNIVQITPIKCTTNGAYRVLSNHDKWQGWWPGPQSNSNTFHFNGGSFSLTNQLNNTLEVLIQQKELYLISTLHLIPAPGDSTIINWSCNISTGINPIARIQKYNQALALKNNMNLALGHFKTFAEKKENIYGISFNVTVFTDSFMVSTKSVQKDYPDVSTVYSQLNAIKKYSASHQAKQTAPPMMNITSLHPAGYQLLTALPVNRQVPASGPFFNQRIPLNRFWVTRVHGGSASVEHAIHQFQLYVQDYQKTVMALPFQKLITDRSAEPDTSRWITDIYFPLF
jgi:hypothetical protein